MKPKSALRHFLGIAANTLLTISCAHAAPSVTWDISPGTVGAGDSAVTGGLGAWNTAAGNWTNDAGVNNIAWDNLDNNTAIFGGAASGIVTLSTAITVGGLTFDTAGYSVAGNTLTFGIAGNIAAHTNATISSILAGSSAITKTGTGTLTLAGANKFSGALTVADGTLAIATINNASANGSLGNSATAVTLGQAGGGTGTLKYTGGSATSSKALSPATGGTAAVEVSSAATTLTLSSVISGGGGLTKTGPGILLFNGGGSGVSNNYTGPTLVAGGVLALGSAWDQGAQSLPGGLTGPTGGLSNLEINGGIVRLADCLYRDLGTGPSNFQITGGVSGFSLQKGDANDSINVNHDASVEIVWGTPTWNPSTLVLNDDAAGPPAGAISIQNKMDLNGATRTITVNSAAHYAFLPGVIRNSTGIAGLTKIGIGELRVSATNTYNGATTLNGGTLDANTFAPGSSNSSIGSSSVAAANLVLNGGTLKHSAENLATTNRLFSVGTSGGTINSSAPTATNSLSFSATTAIDFNSQLGTRTLTLRGSNTGNNTLAVAISNDGSGNATSLTKSDAGTWFLNNNANSYTGLTTITGGALVLSSATALPGGVGTSGGTSNLSFNGGVLGLGFGDFSRSLDAATTTTAATFTGAGGWAAYGADRTVNLGGAAATIAWTNANTGFNDKTVILGATSATHTVELVNPLDLGNAARTLQVDNGSATIDAELSGNLSGTGGNLTRTGSGTLILSGNMSQTGGLSAATGHGASTHFSGTNTYSGNTVNAFSNPASGSLIFQGIQALSPNTALQQTHAGGTGGFGTIKILDDSATPASRSTTHIHMLAASNSHGMSVVVGNNHTANGGTSAGTTTASTITLGNLNISQTHITNTNQTFNLTSANGYKLQIGNVNVSLQAGSPAWTANVVADAPLTVTGNVQQAAGSAGTTTLALLGGAAGSMILGNVLNSADGTPKMLSVSKSGGGTWTLSGTGSTYTGISTITGGILVGIGANAFGSTSAISIGGSGTLSLRGDADTSFVKASDSALYSLSTSAGGATIHVDQATVAGTTAKTMVAGALTTSSTANAYQVNFSGSNHTSLSVGAMTGPANNSSTKKGTVTISNSIASTGTLTLASYTSANVGTAAGAGETLAFSGSGNTTVTGAIAPSATTLNLTKSGAGKTTLSGPNTYTGATAVTLGTLALVGGSQTSAITVESGAKLGFTLGSPTTSTAALTLSAGHAIAITGPVNNSSSYHLMTALSITGTPALAASITNYELQKLNNDTQLWLVYTGTGGSAYDTWRTTNAPSGDPDADFDGDGVSNAVEFVLGGDKNTNDRAKLPEVRTSGANMTFSFKRDQDSIDPKITVMIEVGTDLVTWPTPPSPYAVPDGATVNSPGVTVQKGIPVGGTDTVTLTLPLAPDATKFARLKVLISP